MKQTAPSVTSPKRYENLNALRALSAIGILMMHYLANVGVKPDFGYLSETIIPWFTDFVLLFFMISAFGMCCGYYERFRRGEITPAQFYPKRYSRILPFFILLTVIDIAMSFSWTSVAEGFMNATLTLGLMPRPQVSVIGVGWFLGTIFLFYMLFPYFVYLLGSRRRAWWVLAAAFVVNMLCHYYFFTPAYDVSFDPGRTNILYSGVFLVAGGLIYLYRGQIWRLNAGRLGWLTGVVAVVLTVLYFVCEPLYANHAASIAASVLVFGSWLTYAVAPDKRWMDNRPMRFLGKYSMEIYLCHMVMFRALERVGLERFISDPGMLYLVTCAAGLALAVVFSVVAVRLLDIVGASVRPLFNKSTS